MTISALPLKITGLFVILVLSLSGGLLPLKLKNKNYSLIPISEAFAAGIFLAGGLIHLLHHSAEGLSSATDYPLAYLIAVCTVTLLLVIDKSKKKRKDVEMSDHVSEQPKDKSKSKSKAKSKSKDKEKPVTKEHHHNHDHSQIGTTIKELAKQESISGKVLAIILLLALIIHSALEGISFALVEESEAVVIFIAIIAHKFSAAFALGVAFVKSFGKHWKIFVVSIIIFSLATPIGITIGFGIESYNSNTMINTFLAAAAGSFIYCGIMELNESFDGKNHHKKVIAFILGVVIMACLAINESHSHDDSDDHDDH
ncbi:zinc transporter zip1 [Anaeramoeba flamelloides]|uniref:Zinc transporter zip1 n=1 Tax=Anaeramoeba flamelloides TaxID=1746091 RepID=A0AAV7YK08_9EUKA|nr:zinc transporter zip1 [Anaeramoeba flamelloides]